jgi:hypothetical protein
LKDEISPPRSTPFQKEIAMKRNRGFDEVMIVNPYEPGSNANQGVRFMRFYAAPPGMGYYAEAPNDYSYRAAPANGYGYYAQAPAGYGYYGAPANGYGYYANLPEQPAQYAEVEPGYNAYQPVGYVAGEYPMGYYGDPYAGYYGDPESVGYYGDPYAGYYGDQESVGYYGDPYAGYYGDQESVGYYGYYGHPAGYYAEAPDVEGYEGYGPVGYYAETPEMPGYPRYEPMAEAYPNVAGYGAYGREYDGYVRETRPTYNPGCPMPTNVHGFGEAEMFEGYVNPSSVNPTCGQFTPQPGQESAPPDNFKPLW